MTEQYANLATTTLAAPGITSAIQTTFSVTSVAAFPALPQFRVLIDNEIMLVTAIAGTTFTVVRAVEPVAGSQVPATHLTGATVALILTTASLRNLIVNGPRLMNSGSGVAPTGLTQGDIYSDGFGNLYEWANGLWQVISNLTAWGVGPGSVWGPLPSITSGKLLLQAGSWVGYVSNGSGGFNLGFARAFPTAVISVLMTPGDNTGNFASVVTLGGNCTTSSANGIAIQRNGVVVPNGTIIRVNYIAIGW